MSIAVLEKHLFDMRYTARSLEREARRSDKLSAVEKTKVKQAIQANRMGVAHIHAENSIRHKQHSANMRRMAARVGAVANRVQTAITTKKVSHSMAGVVRTLTVSLQQMKLEKVVHLMDTFDRQFVELDVVTGTIEGGISESTAAQAPALTVDALVAEVAEEAGIELGEAVGQVALPPPLVGVSVSEGKSEDELNKRLAQLRSYKQ